jgi:CRISPR-associated protein Csm3
MVDHVKLYGRIFLKMDIRAVTGLRIGGSPSALQIGGLDNVVIRDPITRRPYIPGSSIRGKMRSLWEKVTNASQNVTIRQGNPTVRLHGEPDKGVSINEDPVCRIFGVTGNIETPNPTRLIVTDALMSDTSAATLENNALTDQPYTETKWEATIDRITSAAVPRQMERVPAGTIFSNCKLVYSIYGTDNAQNPLEDIIWFFDIIQMLQLVEDDYLGSSGSRGSGSVEFENLLMELRVTGNYQQTPHRYMELIEVKQFTSTSHIWQERDNIINWLYEQMS